LGVFLASVAGPLLGGADAAGHYLRLARLVEEPAKIPGAMDEVYAACDAAHEPEVKRRWIWLANYLASYSPQA
jgi:hypothetical protein